MAIAMARQAPTLAALADLQGLLEAHILQLLSAADFASLASTCLALEQAMAQVSTALWATKATACLPAGHPALQSVDAQSVRTALRLYAVAQRNIRSGTSLNPANNHSPSSSPEVGLKYP